MKAPRLEDDERVLVAVRLALRRRDRVPFTQATEARDAALDPAEGPRVSNLVVAQAT